MTRNTISAFAITVLLLISSCSVYQPHLTDAPLIRAKGETRLEGGISLANPAINASFSRGISNKVALQAAANVGPDNYYVQAATGYYKNLSNKGVFEVYGGLGAGYGDDYHDGNPGDLYTNYQYFFTQINGGIIESKKLEYGVALKLSGLHSYSKDKNFFDVEGLNPEYVSGLRIHDYGLMIQPMLFLRFGGPKLKFQIKGGSNFYHQFTHRDNKVTNELFNLSLGVNYRF